MSIFHDMCSFMNITFITMMALFIICNPILTIIIFFYWEECVSSCSHNDSCNFLPLPSILSSPCLLCNDVSGSLNSPPTLHILFSVASPSNYATLDSIVSPPMSSTPHVNTNNHHMFTKGKDGIFKPWSYHAMLFCLLLSFFRLFLLSKSLGVLSLLQNTLNGS